MKYPPFNVIWFIKIFLIVCIFAAAVYTFAGCTQKEEVKPTKAKVTFWTNRNNNCGMIDIFLGDRKLGSLANYSNNGVAPNCDQIEFLTIELDYGSYNFYGKDDCHEWNVAGVIDSPCVTVLFQQ